MSKKSFTAKDAALTINYIGFVFRTLVAEGYSPATLLENTDFTEASFSNPDFRCTFDQHRQFVKNAIAATGDPHLGPRMGARFNPINIGLPASAALSSDVFATALKTLQQFISLNFSILSFDYYEDGQDLILRWRTAVDVSDIGYFVAGSSIAVTENLLKLLLDKQRVTRRAEIAAKEPPGWEEFNESFGFPVQFDALHSQLILPLEYLNNPVAGTDPVVHQQLLRLCEKQKAESFFEEGLDAKVRRLISERHYHNIPIDEAARELGLSERSFRRQLNQSDTSYKKIVDDVRESRAKELLAVSGLPVNTIAFDLGFSDASNFARTFKRWTGQSPLEFRESLLS